MPSAAYRGKDMNMERRNSTIAAISLAFLLTGPASAGDGGRGDEGSGHTGCAHLFDVCRQIVDRDARDTIGKDHKPGELSIKMQNISQSIKNCMEAAFRACGRQTHER